MAVLGDVNHHRLPPPECEIPQSGAYEHGYAEPDVVGHEDEHEEVGDEELHHVQQGLHAVAYREHGHPHGLLAVTDGDVVFAGARVARGVNGLAEHVVPSIFESFVKEGHDADAKHRQGQFPNSGDLPPTEQDSFTVAEVEVHHHSHVHMHAHAGHIVPRVIHARHIMPRMIHARHIMPGVIHACHFVTRVIHA